MPGFRNFSWLETTRVIKDPLNLQTAGTSMFPAMLSPRLGDGVLGVSVSTLGPLEGDSPLAPVRHDSESPCSPAAASIRHMTTLEAQTAQSETEVWSAMSDGPSEQSSESSPRLSYSLHSIESNDATFNDEVSQSRLDGPSCYDNSHTSGRDLPGPTDPPADLPKSAVNIPKLQHGGVTHEDEGLMGSAHSSVLSGATTWRRPAVSLARPLYLQVS